MPKDVNKLLFLQKKVAKMDGQSFLLLALIGIGAGLLSGTMGVGGGVVIVPALVFLMGFSQHMAQGTSIAAIMLLPVGIISVVNYHKAGNVNFGYAAVISAFFLLGSYVSSKWAQGLDPHTIRKTFSVVLVLIAIKMFFEK